ncbi:MAG: hypothetical protein ABIL16_04095 [candidate division WOR-3 bacterium]
MKRYILSIALAAVGVMLIGANGCADQEARNKIAELESKVAAVGDLQSRIESLENRLSELEAKISEMEAKKEEKKTGAAATKGTTQPKTGPLPGKVK